jgi:hypothetical protein
MKKWSGISPVEIASYSNAMVAHPCSVAAAIGSRTRREQQEAKQCRHRVGLTLTMRECDTVESGQQLTAAYRGRHHHVGRALIRIKPALSCVREPKEAKGGADAKSRSAAIRHQLSGYRGALIGSR